MAKASKSKSTWFLGRKSSRGSSRTKLYMLGFIMFGIACTLFLVQQKQDFRMLAAANQQTLTFDDQRANQTLSQYPLGLIDWGGQNWITNGPSGTFKTNNLQFATRLKSASFTFITPRRLISLDAYNYGGGSTGKVTISCAGQVTKSITVAPSNTRTLISNWTANCSPVTVTSTLSWDMLFDNLVIDDASSTAVPTPTPSPVIISTPSPTSFVPTPTPTAVPVSTGMWSPSASTPLHWQYQLASALNPATDLIPNVHVYDIDGFDNSASTVSALHTKGLRAICYIDAGTWENWRPDAGNFPTSVQGNIVSGWQGEKWLDIRQINILQPLMASRMQMCQTKGFDSVDTDNMDGYANSSGFPLTAQNQLDYNKMIAQLAHSYGLSIGLKNDVDQIVALQPYYDWAVNEECYQYNECGLLSPFTNAGKAVFEVEYKNNAQCATTNAMHINSITRNLNLTSPGSSGYVRTSCIPDTQNNW
ncbi:MAG TPA: endo alpha-1,4 polygalactosaminidase [Candidatus Limnocylindrales bacterium]|nr:endo alpha-1,4 polygalactosaminidase [Candidatus Limnocylindrales bacterium]